VRLLVSVSSAAEALEAMAGGAHIIDAKNPADGALGAVTIEELRDINGAIGGRRPLTAAIGDAVGAEEARARAAAFAAAGAGMVKIGFALSGLHRSVEAILAAAVAGAGASGVVAVAFADGGAVGADDVIAIAARAGARGVLLDTAGKSGPGLAALIAPAALAAWIARAHRHGLMAAVAGQLKAADLPMVRDAGADVGGVRGAACDGGRQGMVSRERVRRLVEASAVATRSGCRLRPAGLRRPGKPDTTTQGGGSLQ
jgi:uncharacterized protein (UPF0264 family)